MHNPISIVQAGPADAQLISALSVETFVEAYAAYNTRENMDKYCTEELNVSKMQEELADPINTFFIVKYNGDPVGYAKLRTLKHPEKLAGFQPIEIERFYILKALHGRKIGSALMQHCIDYAQNNGFNVVWLGVWEYNPSAIAFYTHWGFETFDSHIFGFGFDDQTDYMMKKHL